MKNIRDLYLASNDFNTRTYTVKGEKDNLLTLSPHILVTCWRVIKHGVPKG